MKNRVKITTLERILDIIYPCYCKGCGKIGEVFCGRCIFNNMKKNPPISTVKDRDFRRIMAAGMRVDAMKILVSEYKFQARRHYARALAFYLFLSAKRVFPGFSGESKEKYVLVPLPTIQKHIRERGFDHIKKLTDELSAISGIPVVSVIKRNKNTVQVGSSAKRRLEQAKEAYLIDSRAIFDEESHFILVDDVWTTGATMRAARGVLVAELKRRKVKNIKISAIFLAKNSGQDF